MSHSHALARTQPARGVLSVELRIHPTAPSPSKSNRTATPVHTLQNCNQRPHRHLLSPCALPVLPLIRPMLPPSFPQTSLLLTPHTCHQDHRPTSHFEPIPYTFALAFHSWCLVAKSRDSSCTPRFGFAPLLPQHKLASSRLRLQYQLLAQPLFLLLPPPPFQFLFLLRSGYSRARRLSVAPQCPENNTPAVRPSVPGPLPGPRQPFQTRHPPAPHTHRGSTALRSSRSCPLCTLLGRWDAPSPVPTHANSTLSSTPRSHGTFPGGKKPRTAQPGVTNDPSSVFSARGLEHSQAWLGNVRAHVSVPQDGESLGSRDCAKFPVRLPSSVGPMAPGTHSRSQNRRMCQ